MDNNSDGVSGYSTDNSSNASDGEKDSVYYDSDAGPIIDWDGIVHHPLPSDPVCQDDISTICYSLNNSDSGHDGLLFDNGNLAYTRSVESSHGTIAEFIAGFKCAAPACNDGPPSVAVAEVIWSNFTTFRECRFHINGIG